MLTIKEIAQIVGVSRGTVDRVINNRGGVKPETEARIRQVLEAENYTPSVIGQNLAIKKKKLKFGVLLRHTNPRFEVRKAIDQKASELTLYDIETIVLDVATDEPEETLQALDRLLDAGVCGLIVMHTHDPQILAACTEICKKGIPVITMGASISPTVSTAYVGTDFFQCGEIAGYLLNLVSDGSYKTALLTFDTTHFESTLRIQGLQHKLEELHSPVQIVETIYNEDNNEESYQAISRLLKQHPDLNSLFLNSVGVAGACKAIEEAGRPIKVLSFDSLQQPAVYANMKNGIISLNIDQQTALQATTAIDTLFHCCVYGSLPASKNIFIRVRIQTIFDLEPEMQ